MNNTAENIIICLRCMSKLPNLFVRSLCKVVASESTSFEWISVVSLYTEIKIKENRFNEGKVKYLGRGLIVREIREIVWGCEYFWMIYLYSQIWATESLRNWSLDKSIQ